MFLIGGHSTSIPAWLRPVLPVLPPRCTNFQEKVWGYDYEGGSNVVDSIVRSLRKKLGPHSGAIATVTSVGYRFDGL